ncbi:MAG: universal stress protein, partial [Muribaculaceae bacterium]|nr:universal stress protein [Muribaculaceae bacterium]
MKEDRLITVAIHTFDHALKLRAMLEEEGIRVSFQNVNLQAPVVSSGVRVRIPESDLPLALRIIEAPHIFRSSDIDRQEDSHYILVPVDFKPYSMAAAEDAIRIAAAHNADVCLLHSYI